MKAEPSQEVRFIADAMLGRLARWLRLLGFDTLYDPRMDDRDLLKTALREERVLLTRDTHFLNMKALSAFFFVRSETPLEQVKEVVEAFALKKTGRGRCARCNGILVDVIERGSVKDLVPEYVFLCARGFLRCGACGSVYWEGSHLRRFKAMMQGLFGNGGVQG